jgi:hypothetical protein
MGFVDISVDYFFHSYLACWYLRPVKKQAFTRLARERATKSKILR